MYLKELTNSNTNILIVVSAQDLKDFAHDIIMSARAEMVEAQLAAPEQGSHQLLSTEEVCSFFKITKPTLWRWNKAKYLTPVRIGSKNFYNKQDVERLTGR